MANFKEMPLPPSQLIMFPTSIEEALPADCDVRLLGEAMDALDWRKFEASYAETGCPAYPPKVLCKLLVYGYSKGLRSSRALEEEAKHDQRYIWLAGGLQPDHSTLARFRKEKQAWLKEVYRNTVRICTEAGLVLLQVTSTDGSKIRARASKRSLYNAKRVAREMEAIERILSEAEAADQAEDECYSESRADVLPAKLADARQRKEQLTRIAARLAESGRNSVSATEEDCRVMQTNQGLSPAYNAQISVDAAQGVIVAAEMSQQELDNGQLAGQMAQVLENTGSRPEVALADSGYSDEGTFQWLEDTGQEALLPPHEHPQEAKRKDLFASRCFFHDEARDVLICPAGKELTFRRVTRGSSGSYRIYTAVNCRSCSFYAECVKVKSKRGRSIWVSVVARAREKMRQKLKTPVGKALYQLRQQTVEPIFGNFKANLRFSRFGLAGKNGAGAELWLLCTAHNLKIYLRNTASAPKRGSSQFFIRGINQILRSLRHIYLYLCYEHAKEN
jgi:transposase